MLALSATAFYVGVYTLWLKRTSRHNIVIGGAAGAVPVLVGWAAVTNSLGWAPIVLFAAMFFWTPPHFWALAIRYADDYRAADVPMLPAVAPLGEAARQMVVYTVALVASTLLLTPVADLGWIYTGAAARARRRVPRRHDRARRPPESLRVDEGVRVQHHVRHAAVRRHDAGRLGVTNRDAFVGFLPSREMTSKVLPELAVAPAQGLAERANRTQT